MYQYTDKVLRTINRRFLLLFTSLKKRFDELNIAGMVFDTYRKATEAAKAAFLNLAKESYSRAAPGRKNPITEKWLIEYLLLTDPVLQYKYEPEAQRKAGRLAERLSVSRHPKRDIDKAMGELAFQTGQFAVSITDAATIQAWKDDGVTMVRWITAEDEKVCKTCGPRNNKLYEIEKVPPKPHPNCRCELRKVELV